MFSVYASAHALDFAGVNRENMAAFAKVVYALLLEGEEQETLLREIYTAPYDSWCNVSIYKYMYCFCNRMSCTFI